MANEILIVDDNPDIRNILNELISDLGIRQDWLLIISKH